MWKYFVILLAVIGALALVAVFFLASNAAHYSAKYQPGLVTPDGVSSLRIRQEAQPIWQDEAHICGYLALSSIYAAYGIDREVAKLRFRLGVDQRGNAFDASSLGSIHPDVFRVMYQDGFVLQDVDLDTPRFNPLILAHTYQRHLVLFLIKRPQNGNLHWVVAVDPEDESAGSLRIIDSLVKEPYNVDSKAFIDTYVVSALLVFRPTEAPEIDALTLNAMGLASAAKALERM